MSEPATNDGGGRTLLKGGRLLVFDDAPSDWRSQPQDLLIEAGKIAAIDSELDPRGAEVVDARGMIVAPGLVDSHTHLWQGVLRGMASGSWGSEYFERLPPLARYMTPQALHAAVYLGALELLHNGVTCVLDYEYAIQSRALGMAALEGLQAARIRAVLACDLKPRRSEVGESFDGPAERRAAIEWLRAEAEGDSLVSIAVALDDVEGTDTRLTGDAIAWARALDMPMTFHNNGVDELATLERLGLLGPDILPVHSNFVTEADLRALAAVGGTISTQPEAENVSGRRSYAMVARARAHGVDVALGVDGLALSRPSLLAQMRLLYFLQRHQDGAAERAAGRFPIARRDGRPTLTAAYVARAGTRNGAAAIGLGDLTGQIAVGYAADLVLLDTRPFGPAHGEPSTHLVLYSSDAEITDVLVAGAFRKRHGQLVGVDLEAIADMGAVAKASVLRAAQRALALGEITP